jgi:hypothetical protein
LTKNGGSLGHCGAVFDGQFVYYVPLRAYGDSTYQTVVSRYDKSGDFANAASWETFDAGQLNASGLSTGVFDGRYVYFAPFDNDYPALRYDTTLPFDVTSSWEPFTPSSVLSNAADVFASAVFDGRWVMFIGNGDGTTARSMARFDVGDDGAIPDLPNYPGSFF